MKGRPPGHPLIVHLAAAGRARPSGRRRCRPPARCSPTRSGRGRSRCCSTDVAPRARRRDRRAADGRRCACPDQPLALRAARRVRRRRRGAVGQPLRQGEPHDGRARPRPTSAPTSTSSSTAGPAPSASSRPSSTARPILPRCCARAACSVDRLVEVLGSPVRTARPSDPPGSGDDGLALRSPLPRGGGRRPSRGRGTGVPAALAGLAADLVCPSPRRRWLRPSPLWLAARRRRPRARRPGGGGAAGDGLGLAVRDRLSKAAAPRPTVEDAG